jgi:hypothetical protein
LAHKYVTIRTESPTPLIPKYTTEPESKRIQFSVPHSSFHDHPSQYHSPISLPKFETTNPRSDLKRISKGDYEIIRIDGNFKERNKLESGIMTSMKEEGNENDNLMQKCKTFLGSYIGDYEITIFRDGQIHWFTQCPVRSTFSLYSYYSLSHPSLFYFECGRSRILLTVSDIHCYLFV